MKKREVGFTIVELLIVIVVIGILAAITIVAYNGIQNRTIETSVRSNLSSIARQIELKKAELGRYPENVAEIRYITVNKDHIDRTANNVYYCLDITNQTYSFGLRAKNSTGFMLSNGIVTQVSSVNGLATCNHIGVTTWESNTQQAVLQGFTGNTNNFAASWIN